jgi:hypothetical protein
VCRGQLYGRKRKREGEYEVGGGCVRILGAREIWLGSGWEAGGWWAVGGGSGHS